MSAIAILPTGIAVWSSIKCMAPQDGVYNRKLSPFSAFGNGHWSGHGIMGGAPQLLPRYPPSQSYNVSKMGSINYWGVYSKWKIFFLGCP